MNSLFEFISDMDSLSTKVEEELESFRWLEPGWSVMNEGQPISAPVLEAMRSIYYVLRNINFEKFEPQPGTSGEVLLSCIRGNEVVEVIGDRDLHFEFYLEKDNEEVKAETNLDYKSLILEILDLEEWHTLECSTQNITKNILEDTRSLLLKHLTKTEEYPYSTNPAPMGIADQSVPTYRNIIAA